MIDLDIDHLRTRTAAGHGLRETVLYRLLGEVQVYETRECMLEARRCIKHGAVSLDGGILRENGVISLGYGSLSLSLSLSLAVRSCVKQFFLFLFLFVFLLNVIPVMNFFSFLEPHTSKKDRFP